MIEDDRQYDTRIAFLERGYHELDKNNALLSGEMKNLSETIKRLAVTMERMSDELAVIIPKMNVFQQWESIYRNGVFFVVGLVVSGLIGVAIHHFTKQ